MEGGGAWNEAPVVIVYSIVGRERVEGKRRDARERRREGIELKEVLRKELEKGRDLTELFLPGERVELSDRCEFFLCPLLHRSSCLEELYTNRQKQGNE